MQLYVVYIAVNLIFKWLWFYTASLTSAKWSWHKCDVFEHKSTETGLTHTCLLQPQLSKDYSKKHKIHLFPFPTTDQICCMWSFFFLTGLFRQRYLGWELSLKASAYFWSTWVFDQPWNWLISSAFDYLTHLRFKKMWLKLIRGLSHCFYCIICHYSFRFMGWYLDYYYFFNPNFLRYANSWILPEKSFSEPSCASPKQTWSWNWLFYKLTALQLTVTGDRF